jgi:hypothetical protein
MFSFFLYPSPAWQALGPDTMTVPDAATVSGPKFW